MTKVPAPVIDVSNVSQFYGKTRALEDVTISIPSGVMVGLLGPDGVGKSTLLDLIAGARKIQKGDLRVLGGDMRAPRHRADVGPRLAYMPQGLGKNLYHELSVRENLEFFGKLFALDPSERRARIELLTRATGLWPFLNRPAAKLSGGMKQKLGLCCALLHDPDLLLLDEPTTGVDPLSRRQFWELIARIRAARPAMSVVVSTAYMDEAERFDWLIAMDAGQVLATGTPIDLKARTKAPDLETAFVRMLPDDKQPDHEEVSIPPLQNGSGDIAIVAHNLTRRFGDFTAVDDVSFEIQRGEIFGFLGSNGCGKTTTMKMLTGLLDMTEGEALLFGRPVDAKDLDTRKRVGFMSQSFSLYGELTVRQNLELHARLFELPRAFAKSRIRSLEARFGLTDIRNSRSGDLPLGIKQRLSLAVAVLHAPEILILDEPTSGVDPVARDQFWEHLIELSRRDRVTIFISTHFMNEAMRCDRISLMHDGKVLTQGAPKTLMADSGADTLEDAFVHHISNALPEKEEQTAKPDQDLTRLQRVKRQNRWFSTTRFWAIAAREWVEVMRDPIRLAFAFLGPMILLVVLSYGFSMDVDSMRLVVLDNDRSPASRSYFSSFEGSRYFLEEPRVYSRDEMIEVMASGEIAIGIEIPQGFGRDLTRGLSPEVSMWIDGANTMRAGTVEGYAVAGHQTYIRDLLIDAGLDPELLVTHEVQSRYRYNPSFKSINAMGPAMPAILLMLFPAILMAVSITREREIGTITNFYVTPTTKLEYLLGKQLPYVVISVANFLLLVLLITFVLGVPFKGDFTPYLIGALLYGLAVTAWGLVVSSITRTQVSAVFATAILSMTPTSQFSGMVQPLSTLDPAAQTIGALWPASYFLHLSVGSFTKGLGWGALWADLVPLAFFFPVFLMIALFLLRKQNR